MRPWGIVTELIARIMRPCLLAAVAMLLLDGRLATAAEPVKETCGNLQGREPAVRIVGWKGDLLEVFYEGRIVYGNYPESRDWMGAGQQDKLHCDDVKASKDVLAVRMGWKNDLLMVFAFEYDADDRLVCIYKHGWQIRDGEDIDVAVTRNDLGGRDVLVKFGRNKDLRARLCFDKATKKWRRNNQYRGVSDFPSCDMDVATQRVFPKAMNEKAKK